MAARIVYSCRACCLRCLPPSFFLLTSLFPSFYPHSSLHPLSVIFARPMNQSGWQCAAVRELVRVITHVELGQDLDGLSWQQERGASGRFWPCKIETFSFFSWCSNWKKRGPDPILLQRLFHQMSHHNGPTSALYYCRRKSLWNVVLVTLIIASCSIASVHILILKKPVWMQSFAKGSISHQQFYKV